jgi:hypothetical protein
MNQNQCSILRMKYQVKPDRSISGRFRGFCVQNAQILSIGLNKIRDRQANDAVLYESPTDGTNNKNSCCYFISRSNGMAKPRD